MYRYYFSFTDTPTTTFDTYTHTLSLPHSLPVSLARSGLSHPPRFIWRESSLVTVSIFGSAIKRYLQALLSGSARTLGERARTPYAGWGVAVASRQRSEENTSELQ